MVVNVPQSWHCAPSAVQKESGPDAPWRQPDTGPITGDTAACLWDTLTYSVANTANATYCWTVNGGSIVSADTLNSSIAVSWEVAGANGLSVVEGNTFLATGDTQTYFVQVYPPPTASAGTDTIICEGSTHTLSGTIGGSATALLWTSSGDGTFDDSSLAAATYTPGPLDIAAGTVRRGSAEKRKADQEAAGN